MTTPANHIAANDDGTCSDPSCPCHEWARQEAALTKPEAEAALDIALTRARADLNDGKPLTELSAADEQAGFANLSAHIQRGRQVARAVAETNAELVRYASLFTVKAAIADVADAGWNGRPWTLDPDDETEAQTLHRSAFIDAVQQRITTLQQPPHNLDQRLYALLRAVQGDVEEMERLTKGRDKG